MTDRRDDDFRVRPSAPKNRGKGQGQGFVPLTDAKKGGAANKSGKIIGRIRVEQDSPVPDMHVQSRTGFEETFQPPLAVMAQNFRDETGGDERRMTALALETRIGDAPVIGIDQSSDRCL